MSAMLSPGDFWVASGHHLCEAAPHGRLRTTPDLWRAFLARPELVRHPTEEIVLVVVAPLRQFTSEMFVAARMSPRSSARAVDVTKSPEPLAMLTLCDHGTTATFE